MGLERFECGPDLLDSLIPVLGYIAVVKHFAKTQSLAVMVGKAEFIAMMDTEGFKEQQLGHFFDDVVLVIDTVFNRLEHLLVEGIKAVHQTGVDTH
ncbi:hypothetical protein D3C85_1528820 [compost metagenome]